RWLMKARRERSTPLGAINPATLLLRRFCLRQTSHPVRLEQSVDIRRFNIHSTAGEGKRENFFAFKRLSEFQLHHDFSTASRERPIHFRDAFCLGHAFCFDSRGDPLLFLIVSVGFNLRLAETTVCL